MAREECRRMLKTQFRPTKQIQSPRGKRELGNAAGGIIRRFGIGEKGFGRKLPPSPGFLFGYCAMQEAGIRVGGWGAI